MVKMYGGIHYIGKSTDVKPVEGVLNGETFYEVDTKKAYIFYDGGWYDL